jgi:predicted amidohydrolase
MDIRIAGAQIPVSTNIQKNKQELFKAIDWAKENKVQHLLTPEGSLSGWLGWETKIEEVKDALEEVEAHQKEAGIWLHLGTMMQEHDVYGDVFRNEIRHYTKEGPLGALTYKTQVVNGECALGRHEWQTVSCVEFEPGRYAGGLICNDLWGWQESKQGPITTQYKMMGFIDLIFHATNGQKDQDGNTFEVFDKWHDAFLRMSAWNANIPILTVDSCTPWDWDGEDESIIDKFPTSSESGFMHIDGWRTSVPRKGRQYFVHDYTLPSRAYQNPETGDIVEPESDI